MDSLDRRLFTPPKLVPLNLDLASLDGGGSCPAQYEGETHDGREVYCRYRDGYLSVTVASAAGADALRDGTCLLEECIGPPLHGDLSLGQLCHYAGITIAGVLPRLPTRAEKKMRPYFDLSGTTTFYDFHVASTIATARACLSRLQSQLPDASLVRLLRDERFRLIGAQLYHSADDVDDYGCLLLLGDRPSTKTLESLSDEFGLEESFPEATVCNFSYHGFKRVPRPYDSTIADRIAERLAQNLQVAGQNSDCLHQSLQLRASFPTGDAEHLIRVQALDRVLNDCYPMADYLCFGLDGGERHPDREKRQPIDPAIVDWIAGGEDRWYFVTSDGDRENPTFLGYRPRIASQ